MEVTTYNFHTLTKAYQPIRKQYSILSCLLRNSNEPLDTWVPDKALQFYGNRPHLLQVLFHMFNDIQLVQCIRYKFTNILSRAFKYMMHVICLITNWLTQCLPCNKISRACHLMSVNMQKNNFVKRVEVARPSSHKEIPNIGLVTTLPIPCL